MISQPGSLCFQLALQNSYLTRNDQLSAFDLSLQYPALKEFSDGCLKRIYLQPRKSVRKVRLHR